jgi:hypothetical protein
MALTRSVRRVSGQMERGGETKRIISPAEEDVNELGAGAGPFSTHVRIVVVMPRADAS